MTSFAEALQRELHGEGGGATSAAETGESGQGESSKAGEDNKEGEGSKEGAKTDQPAAETKETGDNAEQNKE